jgi:hypothetical protein
MTSGPRPAAEVMAWCPIDTAPIGVWLMARDAAGVEFKAVFHSGYWQGGPPGPIEVSPVEWLDGWRPLPLRATWCKRERDVRLHYPRLCDGHWLSGIFNDEFIAELERRGYDPTTIRFQVKSKPITRQSNVSSPP